MRRLLITMLACAASLAAADYSGIWNGAGGIVDAKYGSIPVTGQLTLVQAGSALKGTFKAGSGKPVPLDSGSVSANAIVFSVGSGAVTGSLAPKGNQLVGTMTSSSGQVVNMVFTPR